MKTLQETKPGTTEELQVRADEIQGAVGTVAHAAAILSEYGHQKLARQVRDAIPDVKKRYKTIL